MDLSRAEAELQQEESALHTELSKLATVSAQLTARLSVARQWVQQAAAAGVADGELSGRLETTQVPPVHADGAFQRARAAREAALQARRETNALVKQQLAALKAQLTKVAQQFLADEQALATKAKEPRAGLPAPAPPARAPGSAVNATVTAQPSPIAALPPPQAAGKPPAAPQSQRVQQRVKMQAAVDFGSDNNFFSGFSGNISDGGLFVATVKHLAIGTQIDLSFSLPSGERIQAQGVVRWVREVNDKDPDSMPGLGVQFTRLDETAQAAIERFVASREPMFYVE
ncbi:MAG: TIGR02266 family protein [Myxococcales bacterium]|nr:TIGR02266 family protein [Myxococcales bacterium]